MLDGSEDQSWYSYNMYAAYVQSGKTKAAVVDKKQSMWTDEKISFKSTCYLSAKSSKFVKKPMTFYLVAVFLMWY